MPIPHSECTDESRAFCDALLSALKASLPDVIRVEKTVCSFAVLGSDQFAHLYHNQHSARVYLRSDEPDLIPALSDGARFQLRRTLGTPWQNEFPSLIELSRNAPPKELAARLLTFSLPLARKKLGSRRTRNRLNAVELFEGKEQALLCTRYERSKTLRAKCLEHHGYRCQGCGVLMAERYGDDATTLIHVHHLQRLADAGEHPVDPVTELVPLCPNCHAEVHLKTPPISVSKRQEIIKHCAAE